VFFPSAAYSIGIVRTSRDAKITTMRNPWLEFPSVSLGRICAKYGGGGHDRVGSIVLTGENASAAEDVLENVVKDITRDRTAQS